MSYLDLYFKHVIEDKLPCLFISFPFFFFNLLLFFNHLALGYLFYFLNYFLPALAGISQIGNNILQAYFQS